MRHRWIALALAVFLSWARGAAAQPPLPPASSTTTAVSSATVAPPALRLLSGSEIPRFEDSFESQAGMVQAAQKTLHYLSTQPARYFRIADRDYAPAQLADSITELLRLIDLKLGPDDFDRAIRENFDVFQSVGNDGAGKVIFSSYYQPVLSASLKKSPKYPFPLYRRPPDMIEADPGLFDKKYPAGDTLICRVDKNRRFVPYFDRDQIDIHQAFAGKGWEVAWLKSKLEVLDLHIQGSGILKFPDGRRMLAGFAATNARPYSSIGLALVKAGVFTKEEISYVKLQDYFRLHPEAQDWALAQNPRYTFFKLVKLPPDGEPSGTTNESLTAARSIAIDQSIIPLGALAFFTTTSPQADKQGRVLGQFANSRFALCMDTGGAIKGPGRVDIYAGHGAQAAATARGQWNEGRLYILIKKLPPRQR